MGKGEWDGFFLFCRGGGVYFCISVVVVKLVVLVVFVILLPHICTVCIVVGV